MFSLTSIFSVVRKIAYYLFGVAALSFLFKMAVSFLKSRTVKKSDQQGLRDEAKHSEKVNTAEKEWLEDSKLTDSVD